MGRVAREGVTVIRWEGQHPVTDSHRPTTPDADGRPGAGRSVGPSSPSTTRPGWRSSPAGCTRPAWRWCRPAGRRGLIEGLGLPVTEVEDLTGFPECLEGRVKTLHPRVHAGILADTRKDDHVRQLAELGIEPFELVVCNLYPFRETVASGAGPDEVIEQIDIGGPSMVRAAAKNHPSVAVVTDPAAYPAVVAAAAGEGFTLAERKRFAAQAFAHTAAYDVAVASWMAQAADAGGRTGGPDFTGATWERAAVLRYGENPHQQAALYRHWRAGLASAEQLHGKEMSYNNYVDADAAVRAAHDHGDQPTVAIIKHANPCGIAVGATVEEAYAAAHACDPVSAYGGIIATNRPVTVGHGAGRQRDVQRGHRRAGVRRRRAGGVAGEEEPAPAAAARRHGGVRPTRIEFRAVSGGVLVQTVDRLDAVVEGDVPGGDDPSRWTARRRARRPTRRRWPTWHSPGGRCGR